MRVVILTVVFLWSWKPAEVVAQSAVPLREYVQTVWTQHDGVPLGRVEGILRTSDGYLWVITREEGLLRFDGMRFFSAPTPCKQLVTHAATHPDGGFWAICGYQLIRRTAAGEFHEVEQDFLRPRPPPVPLLLVDAKGRPWFIKDSLRYLEADGETWREIARPTSDFIRAAAFDTDGALWLTDTEEVVRLLDERVDKFRLEEVWCLGATRQGGVFAITSANAIWRLRAESMPMTIARDLAADLSGSHGCISEGHEGTLWLSTNDRGLVAFRGGLLETLTDVHGWATQQRKVDALFVDHEASVWVGGSGGLHRFRQPWVRHVPLPSPSAGNPTFAYVDSQSRFWVNTGHPGTLLFTGERPGLWSSVERQSARAYAAIGEDENGRIWLSTQQQIGYVTSGRFLAVHDLTGRPVSEVSSFRRDNKGQLWALADGVGLYRVGSELPRLVVDSPAADCNFLVSDRSGIWIGLSTGGVAQHVDGRTNVFRDDAAVGSDGIPRAIVEDADSVWISTGRGLIRWRNGKLTIWTREHGLPGDGDARDIIVDKNGRLWVMTAVGLLMLPRSPLDATPDGIPGPLTFARIGTLDGVVPYPSGSCRVASPKAGVDHLGHLYFVTLDSVIRVDPSVIVDSALAPPIVLEAVSADGQAIDLRTSPSIVEPSRMQFDYTSLNLRSPENARFRYQLEGYDANWVEAGAQRHVTYGTLRPGQYRFRVIGASAEGIWNMEGASFAFAISPVFWRTWWFRATVVGTVLLMMAALYRLRVRQLTRQFNIALEARVSERTRIARELHDTLLQTFQGVLIHFQAATNMLPARPGDAKEKLESVLDQGTRAITEARDAVQALRSPEGTADDLTTSLGLLADEFSSAVNGSPVPTLRVNTEGRPRGLRATIRDHVYRIVSEAVRNAAKHAHAQVIQVDVQYHKRYLRVRVRDDGAGIDDTVLADGALSGHWGLPGMRERAALIGGTLDIRSRLGAGTEIDLSLPGKKAYASSGKPWPWRLKVNTEVER